MPTADIAWRMSRNRLRARRSVPPRRPRASAARSTQYLFGERFIGQGPDIVEVTEQLRGRTLWSRTLVTSLQVSGDSVTVNTHTGVG